MKRKMRNSEKKKRHAIIQLQLVGINIKKKNMDNF